jgi:hypothetical protein
MFFEVGRLHFPLPGEVGLRVGLPEPVPVPVLPEPVNQREELVIVGRETFDRSRGAEGADLDRGGPPRLRGEQGDPDDVGRFPRRGGLPLGSHRPTAR